MEILKCEELDKSSLDSYSDSFVRLMELSSGCLWEVLLGKDYDKK